MKMTRGVLGLLGVLTIAGGALLLATTQRVDQIIGLVVWLGGAILLHDAVLAPVVLALALVLRRLGRRLPWAAVGVIQVALVVGGVLTLVVAPELYAQAKGPANPTVLVGPYGLRLALVWIALAVGAGASVAVLVVRAGRRPRQAAGHRA